MIIDHTIILGHWQKVFLSNFNPLDVCPYENRDKLTS